MRTKKLITKESKAWRALAEFVDKNYVGTGKNCFLCNILTRASDSWGVDEATFAETIERSVRSKMYARIQTDLEAQRITGIAGTTYGGTESHASRVLVCLMFAHEAAEAEKKVYLTAAKLKELNACAESYLGFRRLFGDRAEVTAENVKLAAEKGLDIDWLTLELEIEARPLTGCTCSYCFKSIEPAEFEAVAKALREALKK